MSEKADKKFRIYNLTDKLIQIPKVVDGKFVTGDGERYDTLGTKVDSVKSKENPNIKENWLDVSEGALKVLRGWGKTEKNPGIFAVWEAGENPTIEIKEI